MIFNRSHYEDVLVLRVHELVPADIWSRRYDRINAFEAGLAEDNTHILKFYLHISKQEQLKRFKERLDDPAKQWKISEADYKEQEFWEQYLAAYEDGPVPVQHRTCPVVRHPRGPQVVSEPRGGPNYGRVHGRVGHEIPPTDSGSQAHPKRVPHRGERIGTLEPIV